MTNPAAAPLVAFIHATRVAIAPAKGAFAAQFPGARTWDLLDDQLMPLADAAGGLTPELEARMLRLIDHAILGGADAVQLTCSMYGPVASVASARSVTPIRSSDGAMQRALVASAVPTALVGSSASAVEDSIRRIRLLNATLPELTPLVVPGAAELAAHCDTESLATAIMNAVRRDAPDAERIALGQFSMAPARDLLEESLDMPVLSSPHAAAGELRRVFEDGPAA